MGNLLCFVAIFLADDPDDAQTAYQTALTVLEHQEQLIETFRAELSSDFIYRLERRGPLKRQPHQIVETRKGPKFRVDDECVMDPARSKDPRIDQRAFNGVKQTTFEPLKKRGAVKSSDIYDPAEYWNAAYGQAKPLGQQLRERASEIRQQWVTDNGRRLLEVRWPRPDAFAEVRVWLDPEQRWQPREVCYGHNLPPTAYADGRTREVIRSQMLAYFREGDIVLPSEMLRTIDATYPDGQVVRFQECRTRVHSIHLNEDVSDDVFEIQFPIGTIVYDKDREVIYTAGKSGSEKRVMARSTSSTAATPGPAWTWWGDWRLWVGLSIACGAAFLWFRWR